MLEAVAEWFVGWAQSPYGWLALMVLAYTEAIFLPVAVDPLLIALGVASPPRALLFAAISAAASVLGGLTAFYLGGRGGRPVVTRMIGEARVARVQHLYRKYDVWAILIAGFLPIPYNAFAWSAGIFGIDGRRFVVFSSIARGARFFAVGILIYVFGEAIQQYANEYEEVTALVAGAVVVASIVAIALLIRQQAFQRS